MKSKEERELHRMPLVTILTSSVNIFIFLFFPQAFHFFGNIFFFCGSEH